MRALITLAAALLLSFGVPAEAKPLTYAAVSKGKLSGKVIVQWLEPDVFLFIPDSQDPLVFTRADGTKIYPGRMLTDGGSIPRPLWAFRSYSPWSYGPAFIVHDWLFHLKNCNLAGSDHYDLNKAGLIMAEVMKYMMESGKVEKDPLTLALMYQAVTSPIAASSWNKGRCVLPPSAFNSAPIAEYNFDFSNN